MMSDIDILAIENIIELSKTNEELLTKLKLYFLSDCESLSNNDPARIAWIVYNKIIQGDNYESI
jgi:hypothetical protein